ncbi:MAG TPA: glycosyltransferase WbuB [Paraburkholderia sp.]|jgi:colanic acid biosynthesis glycosyl transferase WcaI|nr:glycosyltransferase WbuB [Paraburkholderia sp.]
MKILVYGLNFAPELSGVGKYTAEMTELLAARGHDVRVVCAPPYYPHWRVQDGYRAWRYRHETWRGIRVWRAPLWVPSRPGGLARLVHLASFALASLPLVARQTAWRPDVVMVIAPTLACAPGALAFAWTARAKTWLHIQDFEVDAAFDLGLLQGGFAARVAHAVERVLLRRFHVVSSISARMVERVTDKGVDPQRAVCVPNWVDTDAIFPLASASAYRRQFGIPARNVVVLYSGNMGAKQGIDSLADVAAALASRDDISFVFCGDGAAKRELVARCASLRNCHLLPLQPATSLNELLNVADIHVLPQRNDAADLVMPSKLTGMLASGRAIVAMARPGTSLFDVASKYGVVVPPEDGDALAAAIVELAADPARRAALGDAARQYALRTLSPASTFSVMEARLARLARGVDADSHAAPATADADAAAPRTRDEAGIQAGTHAAPEAGPELPEVEQTDVR